VGKVLWQCAADGKTSAILETCATAELCAASDATGCKTPACPAGGDMRCSGAALETCNTGRTAWVATQCPTTCSALTCHRAVDLVAGDHTCARLDDGSIYCWGTNNFGQVGDGTNINRPSPTLLAEFGSVTQLAAGPTASGARMADGTIRWWGFVPDPTASLGVLLPKAVTGISTALEFRLGQGHVCVRLSDLSVQCWGNNNHGQLGDDSSTDRFTPGPALIDEIRGLGLGWEHTCATRFGATYCWGYDLYGQIGDGASSDRLKPYLLSGFSFEQIAASSDFTCARGASGVHCWGANSGGRLGDGTTKPRSMPSAVVGLDGLVVTGLGVGGGHACVLVNDGSVRCWGSNTVGQVGDGSTDNRPAPVPVATLSDASKIAVGTAHSCAILKDGSIRCWGGNGRGQLGIGTLSEKETLPTRPKW
jgi:alpha-tubulin suppressor-like RCC1 family protein